MYDSSLEASNARRTLAASVNVRSELSIIISELSFYLKLSYLLFQIVIGFMKELKKNYVGRFSLIMKKTQLKCMFLLIPFQ